MSKHKTLRELWNENGKCNIMVEDCVGVYELIGFNSIGEAILSGDGGPFIEGNWNTNYKVYKKPKIVCMWPAICKCKADDCFYVTPHLYKNESDARAELGGDFVRLATVDDYKNGFLIKGK